MTEREKVLTGLECCINSVMFDPCPPHCPYYKECLHQVSYSPLLADCIKLLKDRDEPIKPTLNESHGYVSDAFNCGKCGHTIRFHAKYCENCGQAVKWIN